MSTNSLRTQNLICALDIGTTKVCFLIANVGSKGLEILGMGQAQHGGVRHGAVVNIEATSEAITKAREEAELMAGTLAHSVFVSVGGTHIQSFNSDGMIAVRNQEVNHDDIDRVVEAAKAVAIPSDREVLHVLTQEFILDGQEGILDPIGMSGVRLEASVHIITGNRSVLQNVRSCVDKANLRIESLVLTPLASSLSVIGKDEKNIGVSVIDIGGGSCDLITYQRGSVFHTSCIPVGGINFTQDVALGLRATQINAEEIKVKYGSALPNMIDSEETIEVESVGGRDPRSVPLVNLSRVLEARADETLKLIYAEIQKQDFVGKLGSGIVVTGGGSELKGLVEMGDFVFDMPVRRGLPKRLGGLTDVATNPTYATVVGLILYGFDHGRARVVSRELHGDLGARMSDIGRRIKDFFARSL